MLKPRLFFVFLALTLAGVMVPCGPLPAQAKDSTVSETDKGKTSLILLPKPRQKSTVSVEEAIASRRTKRSFSPKPLTLEALSQILWAAQGITGKNGHLRTAPSGGALYPLDVFVVVGPSSVEGLKQGVYLYTPKRQALRETRSGDLRNPLARDCLGQMWMAQAPVIFVITAEYERIERKYGPRGRRYADMESGHACQNIFLQAEALGLAAGIVGAFQDERVSRTLHLPASYRPLLVMPVGHP